MIILSKAFGGEPVTPLTAAQLEILRRMQAGEELLVYTNGPGVYRMGDRGVHYHAAAGLTKRGLINCHHLPVNGAHRFWITSEGEKVLREGNAH